MIRTGTDSHSIGTVLLAVTADVSLVLLDGLPQYLAEQGWNVHVVASPGQRSDLLRSEGVVKVHGIPMKRNPSPLSDMRALVDWIRILRMVRPDVVAPGTPKAALLCSIAAWVLRVPDRVYIVRGLRLETAAGLLRHVLSLMEKCTFALSSRALAVSTSLRDEAVRLRLVKADKITVLGKGSSKGVDVHRFRPREANESVVSSLRESLGLRGDLPTVGFVGRLNSDKGLNLLSSALERMDSDASIFQILIVGEQDGDNGLAAGFQGANVHVAFAGQVTDTSPYFGLIDVLCLPTLREGFPNVVLEAAACGVPAITTTATGAIDSVVDGETGIIVDKNDPMALARALSQLISDANLRESMGRNAREWVLEHFQQETVWRRINDFLLNGQARRGMKN